MRIVAHSLLMVLSLVVLGCGLPFRGTQPITLPSNTSTPDGQVEHAWITGVYPRADGEQVMVKVSLRRAPPPKVQHGPPYTAVRVEDWQLWLLNVTDGSVKLLPSDIGPMTGVTWRPGSNQVAYSTLGFSIEILDIITGDRVNISNETERISTFMWPLWSPDGSRLTFQANAYYDATKDGRAILSVAPSQPQSLTHEALDLSEPRVWCWMPDSSAILYVPEDDVQRHARPSSARVFLPDWEETTDEIGWSSDGEFLGCIVSHNGEYSVRVLDRSLTKIVFDAPISLTATRNLRWSPKGHRLLIARGEIEELTVFMIDASTGNETQLKGLEGMYPAAWVEGSDGKEKIFLVDKESRTLLLSELIDGPVRQLATLDDKGVLKTDAFHSGQAE